jgi:hypothetical protein
MPSQKEVFAAQKAAKEQKKLKEEADKIAAAAAAVKAAEIAEENKRSKAIIARREAKAISSWKAHNMETGRVVNEAQAADEIRHMKQAECR